MRLKLLLADSAEVREGLLFLLGGGWTQVGPAPQPFAIAGVIEVGWDETNTRHQLVLTMEDADGVPFLVSEGQPFRIETAFDFGSPPGVILGQSFILPLAFSVNALPWQPARHYIIRATLDGNDVDRLTFWVRPSPRP